MSNIIDYIRWRGDLSFTVAPFCEVDALILSQFSMFFWEDSSLASEPKPLIIFRPELKEGKISAGFAEEDNIELLNVAMKSERFGSILISDYVSEWDKNLEKQFAAVTFKLPDETRFISFRGTDSTIIGWKEDFKLAYSRPIHAQGSALSYLENIAEIYPEKLRIGGHSKGGNLAMYASAMTSRQIRDRIIAVYNNDGPGLSERMDAKSLYAKIDSILHSFVPQSSVIGMLLDHPDRFEVVRSDSVSVWQHNPYRWRVEGPRFVRADGLTKDSVYFNLVFAQWLAEVDEEERNILVDTIFEILNSANAENFGKEFWKNVAKNPRAIVSSIKHIDPETRKRISAMLADLASSAVHRKSEKDNK